MHKVSLAALAATGLVVALASHIASAESPVDLKNHRPRFHWKTDAQGQHSLYDGEKRVADFFGGSQEMQGIGRPISLHNLCLIPGGPPAIERGESCGPLCLSWRKHLIFYMKLDELSVGEKDPERFTLYVKSHDIGLRADQPFPDEYDPNNAVEESRLEVTYDPALPSYVFDVKTKMTVQPGREQQMIARDMRGLEFADILPANCNLPPDRKQFHDYAYKGRDGIYYRLPHNLHKGPEKEGILFARGGTMAFLLEPAHNPVVELVGDTGLNSFSEICHAMYDVHFKFAKEKELELLTAGKPLKAHFRLYSISKEAGRKMLEQSIWDPKLQLPGAHVDHKLLQWMDPSAHWKVWQADIRAQGVGDVDKTAPGVQRLKTAGPLAQPVNVFLRGGIFELPQTLQLSSEDSGTAEAPVTYRSNAGEEAMPDRAVPERAPRDLANPRGPRCPGMDEDRLADAWEIRGR